MEQTVTHIRQVANCLIQFLCLCQKQLSIDVRLALGGNNSRDFVKRKSGGSA
jgi:hypothetical protein